MASLDKWSAQKVYWSSFGLPAYEELTVPDDAQIPYIAYQAVNGQLDGVITVSASIYYKGMSWSKIIEEVNHIEKFADRQIMFDGGIMKVRKPLRDFAQPISETSDSKIRRMLLTVEIEFLSA